MPRPYRITVQIGNSDKGPMDRTELHIPSMSGENAKEVADKIAALLNVPVRPAKTAQSEHDRLVAQQNEPKKEEPGKVKP